MSARRLKAARKRLNMTQRELGIALGYDADGAKTIIYRMEAGFREVSPRVVLALEALEKRAGTR